MSVEKWQGYDELFENLTQWVKETETQVRNNTGSCVDLMSKLKQRDLLQVSWDVIVMIVRQRYCPYYGANLP